MSCLVLMYLELSMVCSSKNDGLKIGNIVSEGTCSLQLLISYEIFFFKKKRTNPTAHIRLIIQTQSSLT